MIPELGCSGSVQSSVGHLVIGMVVDSAVPRVVHFCASLGTPCRWSLCLEGLYRKRRSASFVGLCSARLPAIVHSSALVRRVSASASGVHSRRRSDATLRSCRRCVWPCASWSVGTSRRRHARIDSPVSMSLLANVPIARPCGRSCAPRAAHPELLLSQRGDYSCSLTVLCTLSP